MASGRRVIDRTALQAEIRNLNLDAEGAPQQATLLVQEIDRDCWPESASAALDWVDLFPGAEPRERRRIADQDAWERRMRPDLARAAAEIRRQGYRQVLIRGSMRLPSWFAAGVHFADSAGWRVSCVQQGNAWDSSVSAAPMHLKKRRTPIGQGQDLAVGLSVTASVAREVRRYVRDEQLPVKTYLDL